jgi:hypothetical protein
MWGVSGELDQPDHPIFVLRPSLDTKKFLKREFQEFFIGIQRD